MLEHCKLSKPGAYSLPNDYMFLNMLILLFIYIVRERERPAHPTKHVFVYTYSFDVRVGPPGLEVDWRCPCINRYKMDSKREETYQHFCGFNSKLVGALEHDFYDFPYTGNKNPN